MDTKDNKASATSRSTDDHRPVESSQGGLQTAADSNGSFNANSSDNDEIARDLDNAQQCEATEMIAFLYSLCCANELDLPSRDRELMKIYRAMKTLASTDHTLRCLVGQVSSTPQIKTASTLSKAVNYALNLLSGYNSPLIPKFERCRQLVTIPSPNTEIDEGHDLCIVYWNDLASIPELQGLKYEDTYREGEHLPYPDIFRWSHIQCSITVRRDGALLSDGPVPTSFPNSYYGIRQHELRADEPKVHTAINNSHRMASYFDMTHTISLIVIGRYISLTWADRQGIIQSTMFSLVDGLPHFLLLLLILQRFEPSCWGYGLPNKRSNLSVSTLCTSFQVIELHRPDHAYKKPSKPVLYFCPFADTIHRNCSATGRGTWVMGGSQRPPSTSLRSKKDLVSHNDYVVKSAWPYVRRTSEATILRAAHELSHNCGYIRGHIPALVAVSEPQFTTSTTETIRRFLGLSVKGARRLRMLVLERLAPIACLPEEEMVSAFLQIFFCHRALWIRNIQHLDISVDNLMWSKVRRVGVLNDFDLARICTHNIHPDLAEENIGTPAYMALDLLTDEPTEGSIERLYRHDAESLSWCLVDLFITQKRDGINVVPRSESSDIWGQETQRSRRRNRLFKYNIWRSDIWPKPTWPAFPNIGPTAHALALFWSQFHQMQQEDACQGSASHNNGQGKEAQEEYIWRDLIVIFLRENAGSVFQSSLDELLVRNEVENLVQVAL